MYEIWHASAPVFRRAFFGIQPQCHKVRIAKIESAIELKKQVAELRLQLPENSFLIKLTSEQTAIANQIGEVYRNHTSIWRSIK